MEKDVCGAGIWDYEMCKNSSYGTLDGARYFWGKLFDQADENNKKFLVRQTIGRCIQE